MPFRCSLLGAADVARQVQPVSVVYDRLGGLPACRRDRPLFAWYGDMDIGSHFWRLARRSGARATVLLHEPFCPTALPNRKALAAEAGRIVAEGAAALRQNWPVGAVGGAGAVQTSRLTCGPSTAQRLRVHRFVPVRSALLREFRAA